MKETTYYIYHIDGIKIGCSTNAEKRVKKQGYTDYTILETHTDIEVASNREIELQKEYGYKVDNIPYSISIQHFDKAKSKIDLVTLGKKLNEWQKKTNFFQTDEFKKGSIKGGVVQGERNKTNGHMDMMRDKGNFNRKQIIGYNRFTNELIGEWNSLTACALELGTSVAKISLCINGKRKYHRDYTFQKK